MRNFKKVKSKCKVYAKTFPGATTQCMADYMKPSVRAKPDHIILHVGTNDLNSNATPNEIASNIVNIATEMKTEKCDVSISAIIIRTDKQDLNEKGLKVNVIVKEMCMEKSIRTVYNGSECMSFLGPKISNILPDNLKNASSLEVFKASIKSRKPEKCPCRLCRLYVQNVGFV